MHNFGGGRSDLFIQFRGEVVKRGEGIFSKFRGSWLKIQGDLDEAMVVVSFFSSFHRFNYYAPACFNPPFDKMPKLNC